MLNSPTHGDRLWQSSSTSNYNMQEILKLQSIEGTINAIPELVKTENQEQLIDTIRTLIYLLAKKSSRMNEMPTEIIETLFSAFNFHSVSLSEALFDFFEKLLISFPDKYFDLFIDNQIDLIVIDKIPISGGASLLTTMASISPDFLSRDVNDFHIIDKIMTCIKRDRNTPDMIQFLNLLFSNHQIPPESAGFILRKIWLRALRKPADTFIFKIFSSLCYREYLEVMYENGNIEEMANNPTDFSQSNCCILELFEHLAKSNLLHPAIIPDLVSYFQPEQEGFIDVLHSIVNILVAAIECGPEQRIQVINSQILLKIMTDSNCCSLRWKSECIRLFAAFTPYMSEGSSENTISSILVRFLDLNDIIDMINIEDSLHDCLTILEAASIEAKIHPENQSPFNAEVWKLMMTNNEIKDSIEELSVGSNPQVAGLVACVKESLERKQ